MPLKPTHNVEKVTHAGHSTRTKVGARLVGRVDQPPIVALPGAQPHDASEDTEPRPTVFVVDDDYFVRSDIKGAMDAVGWTVRDFESCELFLSAYRPAPRSCLVLDAHMPAMDGLELVERLRSAWDEMPVVMISGSSDIATAVAAMKAGADDFFEKPVDSDALLAGVGRALRRAHGLRESGNLSRLAAAAVSRLTNRQLQVMELVVAGQPSKIIAADLGVSQRTVETHRASIMRKTGATSIPALARLALAAASLEGVANAEP